jgi:hypothetical protein
MNLGVSNQYHEKCLKDGSLREMMLKGASEIKKNARAPQYPE